MIPYPSSGLKMLAERVLGTVVPALGSKYAMSDAAMLTMLMVALAEEMESGVARRLQDIEAMNGVFQIAREAGIEVAPTEAIASDQQTLSRVNELHDEMTVHLMTLHARVEASDEYRELNLAVWRYLHANAERHKLAL
ncbi:MAG: 2-hydroxychromene-2-carboxylate isomerase [Candidatus Azotimanducaceae bacterium]|jgi:2-hydroxychromene-2-carboxylate isomerase